MLGQFNWEQTPMSESTIKLVDLGLSSDRENLVYEFSAAGSWAR